MTTRNPNAIIFAARILELVLELELELGLGLGLAAGLLVAVWVGNVVCAAMSKDVDGVTVGSEASATVAEEDAAVWSLSPLSSPPSPPPPPPPPLSSSPSPPQSIVSLSHKLTSSSLQIPFRLCSSYLAPVQSLKQQISPSSTFPHR